MKIVTAKVSAYHEENADELGSNAIESEPATSTVHLIQVPARCLAR